MLTQAAICYLRRKYHKEYPNGFYEQGALWYPSEDEKQPCCDQVSLPSKKNRLSLKQHCCSYRHIANLYGVDELELRRLVTVIDVRRKAQKALTESRRVHERVIADIEASLPLYKRVWFKLRRLLRRLTRKGIVK